MTFTLKDLNGNILHTGTKQDCMHFMKAQKFNRANITIQKLDSKPAPHYTVPITAEEAPPKSWIKRVFS